MNLPWWVTVLASVIFLIAPFLKPKKKDPGPSLWVVWVGAARKQQENYSYDYTTRYSYAKVDGEMAVMLRRLDQWQPFGTVKLAEDGFDAKLNAMVSEAEDRCTTLNAVYAEVGR